MKAGRSGSSKVDEACEMVSFFSQRNREVPELLIYEVPEHVRRRVLATFGWLTEEYDGMNSLLRNATMWAVRQYGGLHQSHYRAARRSDDPAVEHFLCCPTEHALDFIEMCLQSASYRSSQKGVDEINRILREEGIGFELTPWVERHVERKQSMMGRVLSGTPVEIQYPQFIRKNSLGLHGQVVMPCLEVLGSPEFRVANSELLKAHEAVRRGDHANAITLCGAAFESTLKTICGLKGWRFDPDKDTCARLIALCKENGLFPPFYAPILESTGTLRNKLGDAHGRGPSQAYKVESEQVDHMIHLTSAHVLFLVHLALPS